MYNMNIVQHRKCTITYLHYESEAYNSAVVVVLMAARTPAATASAPEITATPLGHE